MSDLIKLSILKPAAHDRYRVEEVAAFLGDYPPISPVPYEKGRWILINLVKSDTISCGDDDGDSGLLLDLMIGLVLRWLASGDWRMMMSSLM